MKVKDILEDGKYLPEFMRDFHDQKDLFRTISDMYDRPKVGYVNPTDAHVYTIDYFLWFMANHGYKLQKIRRIEDAQDPVEKVAFWTEYRLERQAAVLKSALKLEPEE